MCSRPGIPAERIVLDPGICFSKTAEQNHDLIRGLGRLRSSLGRPVLAGPSRKSFIGKLLPETPVRNHRQDFLTPARFLPG